MVKKILILDDDPDILEIVSYLLVESSYEVRTRPDGHDVFETIRSFHPDLILMDVMLDDMDGREICAAIKSSAETCRLPVMLISGTHDLAAVLQLSGAPDDFLAKPFDIDELLRKIQTALNKRQV